MEKITSQRMGIIIPTKDRPDELSRLLESITIQEIKPFQIIIVDGGQVPIRNILDRFFNLNIDYIRRTPPSLTAQRNAGIKALRGDITLVVFFDDDIVLEEGSLNNMIRFWESAPVDVGGASFNLINQIYKAPTVFERIFLVNTHEPNRILRSGFQGKISVVNENHRADWLIGCAMVFRKNIFEEFMFDERFSGYARYEDADFTYRVSKMYKMFVVADAKVRHLNKVEGLDFSFSLGKMEVINKIYFVKKHRDLSLVLCYWALFGILLNNILKNIFYGDRRYLYRARGNMAGLMHVWYNAFEKS